MNTQNTTVNTSTSVFPKYLFTLQTTCIGKCFTANLRTVVPKLWSTSFIQVVLGRATAMVLISHYILISYYT